MDLLDRINSLTDDQLRMIADRDDAGGVLASYRLAELRGLPMPDRETVILGDGYVIVAQSGQVQKIPVDTMEKVIRQEQGEYCVYSEDGEQSFGCYKTMSQAEERLRQIHFFREAVREGSFVSWNSSGGRARGQVEHVMYEGVLGIPGSDFQINAEDDDPAVLIRVWQKGADGWAGTETLVGHKMSTLTRIDALSKETPTKRENGMDFPAVAYAYVPDPVEPATWALRVWETPETMETREQIGRALENLDSVRIPTGDRQSAQDGINRAVERLQAREGKLSKETFVPPQGVQDAAQRALDWIGEGHAGSGFTDVGRARAAQLARGDGVSEETIRRVANYLSRHGGDSRAEKFSAGEDGFPSPGRVAWDAWGGDDAVAWSTSIVERLNRTDKRAVPEPITNLHLNLVNRQHAIDEYLYGPLNPEAPGDYWDRLGAAWGVSAEEAATTRCGNCAAFNVKTDILGAISGAISDAGDEVVDAAGLGYCELFQFKCASARSCSAWLTGGPITDSEPPEEQAKSVSRDGRFLRKEAAQRFTLGPLYVPDFMDAHGEWTDSNELQQGVWGWVQSEDRTIYLQHDTDVRAGEWVEVMTMPQPWTVHMVDGAGNQIGKVTYPTGTVFLGVIWDEDAWKQIVAGELRGYSIGGLSDRVLADLPEQAVREGIEVDG